MLAITLHQPWASQIFHRIHPKDVENRTTLCPSPLVLGGERHPFIAIHAGLTYNPEPAYPPGVLIPAKEGLPFGAIIGVVRVAGALDLRPLRHVHGERENRRILGVDGTKLTSRDPRWRAIADMDRERWWLGPIGWRLIDAIPIVPVSVRGMLGMWKVPAVIAQEVAQKAAAVANKELMERGYRNEPDYCGAMSDKDLMNAASDLEALIR